MNFSPEKLINKIMVSEEFRGGFKPQALLNETALTVSLVLVDLMG